MPRPRFRIVAGGAPLALDAPGLALVPWRSGRYVAFWRAPRRAVRLGYQPRNVRLHYAISFARGPRRSWRVEGEPAEIERLAAACRGLQAEMLRWLAAPGRAPKIVFNGLVESLIEVYLRHPLSPFRALNPNTQECYEEWCAALRSVAGKRRVDKIVGPDLREWFAVLLQRGERLAYGAVRQMPRILVNFGMELGLAPCFRFSQILTITKLKLPRDPATGRRKKRVRVAMSYAQAEAIVGAGLGRGTVQHRSVALGVAAQFEFALNQIDVIGWWEKLTGAEPVPADAYVSGGWIWRAGLTWEDLASGVLAVDRNKTGVPGVYDLAQAPLFQKAITAVPQAERRGALAVDSRGEPMQRRYYADLYRELADIAGVPAAVKNMHARHGAANEADDAGVTEDDITRLTRNTKPVLRGHYLKGSLVKARKTAQARVESRGKKESA